MIVNDCLTQEPAVACDIDQIAQADGEAIDGADAGGRGSRFQIPEARTEPPVAAYSAKARFSRGAAKSRKARTLIGRKRLAA